MNAGTWAVDVFAPTVLACVPFVWLAVRGFRANARERALDRAVDEALPKMWAQVYATLKRRQP